MTTEKRIEAINKMTYHQMLILWRFEPVGSPWFSGEVGDHFKKVMHEKRKSADHVAISKSIGWEKRS